MHSYVTRARSTRPMRWHRRDRFPVFLHHAGCTRTRVLALLRIFLVCSRDRADGIYRQSSHAVADRAHLGLPFPQPGRARQSHRAFAMRLASLRGRASVRPFCRHRATTNHPVRMANALHREDRARIFGTRTLPTRNIRSSLSVAVQKRVQFSGHAQRDRVGPAFPPS